MVAELVATTSKAIANATVLKANFVEFTNCKPSSVSCSIEDSIELVFVGFEFVAN